MHNLIIYGIGFIALMFGTWQAKRAQRMNDAKLEVRTLLYMGIVAFCLIVWTTWLLWGFLLGLGHAP